MSKRKKNVTAIRHDFFVAPKCKLSFDPGGQTIQTNSSLAIKYGNEALYRDTRFKRKLKHWMLRRGGRSPEEKWSKLKEISRLAGSGIHLHLVCRGRIWILSKRSLIFPFGAVPKRSSSHPFQMRGRHGLKIKRHLSSMHGGGGREGGMGSNTKSPLCVAKCTRKVCSPHSRLICRAWPRRSPLLGQFVISILPKPKNKRIWPQNWTAKTHPFHPSQNAKLRSNAKAKSVNILPDMCDVSAVRVDRTLPACIFLALPPNPPPRHKKTHFSTNYIDLINSEAWHLRQKACR